ncbi:MAG: RNA-binding S4 domain-containing protein [Fidelibacterota bacterium]|nr:MAG: RNA-binding S4 domain-containing protein [Candidatus Neomarinimicrobiota bacterium]
MDELRLDKWLWAARFYKTRRQATQACQAGKVKLNGQSAKPGKSIKIGDELQITRKMYKQQIRITGLNQRRTAPRIAAALYDDLTSPEVIEQAQLQRTLESAFYRDRRKTGRPTKRDRRLLQRLKGRD